MKLDRKFKVILFLVIIWLLFTLFLYFEDKIPKKYTIYSPNQEINTIVQIDLSRLFNHSTSYFLVLNTDLPLTEQQKLTLINGLSKSINLYHIDGKKGYEQKLDINYDSSSSSKVLGGFDINRDNNFGSLLFIINDPDVIATIDEEIFLLNEDLIPGDIEIFILVESLLFFVLLLVFALLSRSFQTSRKLK